MFVKIKGYSIFLDKLILYVTLNPKFCLSFVNECNTRNTSYHHFEGVAPYILIIPPGKTVHNSSHKTTIRLGFLFLPAPCLFTVATKRVKVPHNSLNHSRATKEPFDDFPFRWWHKVWNMFMSLGRYWKNNPKQGRNQ